MPTTGQIWPSGYASVAAASDEWVRPADWLPLPTVTAGEAKFVGLVAVYPGDSNWVVIFHNGGHSWINWGDGSAVQFGINGTLSTHRYTYDSLPSNTTTSEGYRQAIVSLTPQAGQTLSTFQLNQAMASFGPASNATSLWLDIAMALPSITTLDISGTGAPARLLQRFTWVGTSPVLATLANVFGNAVSLRVVDVPAAFTGVATTMAGMFNGCDALRTAPALNTATVTSFSQTFLSCRQLTSVPLYDMTAATTTANMFANCPALRTVPDNTTTGNVLTMASMFSSCLSLITAPMLNTVKVTSFASMFNDCRLLRTVPLYNMAATGINCTSMFASSGLVVAPFLDTVNVTNFTTMFQSCTFLQAVPLLNAAAGTVFTNMFQACFSLAIGAISGPRFTISYASCKMSGAQLDAVYNNLASGVTGQTVTVSGNWGSPSDTPAIATAKGWTVSG